MAFPNNPDPDNNPTRRKDPSSSDSSSGAKHITQKNRPLAIITPLGEDILLLRSCTGTECLGQPSQFELDLLSEQRNEVDAGTILGKNVTVRLNQGGGRPVRYFNGYISSFRALGTDAHLAHFGATMVPWLWFLTLRANCRIFQNQTTLQIVKTVCGEHGFSQIEERLSTTFAPREYCVQYRETDFNFVSRLLEREGIYYYFEHKKSDHTLVLCDHPGAHQPRPDTKSVEFSPLSPTITLPERVSTWGSARTIHPLTASLDDYDFTRPNMQLFTTANAPDTATVHGQAEIYDYPGEYLDYSEGERYSQKRVEEFHARHFVYFGDSNVRGLCVGAQFRLDHPSAASLAGDFLVVQTDHRLVDDQFRSQTELGQPEEVCTCAVRAMRAAEQYRPLRLTPEPVIQGVQTAVVVGPKGQEIHTDIYGRIKVQFFWDREGQRNENSSCFMRVAEVWAGRRWGATFTPRIGQEVIVDFLEGDPDRPLVVGSLYNGDQRPPYLGEGLDPKHPNDPNVSGIKSCSTLGGRGYNEWRFTDTKGKEQIFMHAEKDMDVRVKNDVRTDVGGSTHLTVGFQDANGELHGFIKEKVFRSKSTHALKSIGESADETHFTSVGTGGEYCQLIDSDGNFSAQAKQVFSVNAGTVLIEAGADGQICLKCGASFIVLKPDGIYVNGPMVYVNSGGSATGAKEVGLRAPLEPDRADDSKSGSPSTSGEQDR